MSAPSVTNAEHEAEARGSAHPVPSLVRERPVLPDSSRAFLSSFLLALAVRLGLVLVAYLTGRAFFDFRGDSLVDILTRAATQWDAVHYLRIATEGYGTEGDALFRLNFLPLYPLVIRFVSFFVSSTLLAALLVSFLASVTAGLLLYALAFYDSEDAEIARRSLWYFFLFPTAYFLALPYAEATFLFLVLAAFLAARSRRWTLCGVAGMLAAATRVQGICLVPALIVEAVHQEGRASWRRCAWLLLVPLGFASYLFVNWRVVGDPFGFLNVRREGLSEQLVAPWQPVLDAARRVLSDPPSRDRAFYFEARLVSVAVGASLLLAGARRLRASYQVYAWAALFLPLFSGMQIGFPRFLLVIFPLFLVLGRVSSSSHVQELLLPLSALLQAGLFTIYAAGRWAF